MSHSGLSTPNASQHPRTPLSHKGSLPVDGQAATPASVSSVEASFQQAPSDSTATLEPKVEVKAKDEEEEEAMEEERTAKEEDSKTEEKPEVKKEEPLSDGGPMETASDEDKKPEIKIEPKEEEEGSESATSQSSVSGATNKKKIFKPEELRQALMPTLESLYRQDPESLPFRQPVDPSLLGIPVRMLSACL